MDTNVLINLIETVSKTLNAEGFEHIELNHEGTKLVLNKKSVQASAAPVMPMAAPVAAPAPVASASSSAPAAEVKAAPVTEAAAPAADEGDFEIQESPIVGTFYNAPSPEADPFVKVGDKVKKGDILCIIEAMKLMNEIESDFDGEIAEILVDNEGGVEYGQPLFKIKA